MQISYDENNTLSLGVKKSKTMIAIVTKKNSN